MKYIYMLLSFWILCVTLVAQEHQHEGIYYVKKIQKGKGFSCFSLNENQTLVDVIISVGSFDHISEEKYTIVGDTIKTERGWIIVLSKYKKADQKMINEIEKKFGKVLNGYGYCINKNHILRCKDSIKDTTRRAVFLMPSSKSKVGSNKN